MSVWSVAKTPVKVFLNSTFGQFLAQPLDDSQIFITSSGIGCKDLYFSVEKINSLFAERGIPIIICVAYISELVICLPSSVEVSGIDLVFQTTSGVCMPAKDDASFSSMFSSMTAVAFAAAKVADDAPDWLNTTGLPDGSSDEEPADGLPASSGLRSIVTQFFERLLTTVEKVNIDHSCENHPLVDHETKEQLAYMIDSLIAQTTIILRKLNVRIECQLGLPGLNRASGIEVNVELMSVANQNLPRTTEGSKETVVDQSHPSHSTGDCWSWLWSWAKSRKNANVDRSSQPASLSGSLSTMLHKDVLIEGVDLFWDLWDTREQSTRHGSFSSSTTGPHNDDFISGAKPSPVYPTEENMIASAKLLSLPGSHTARISLRCPLFSLSRSETPATSSELSNPTRHAWSLSELRVHSDIGPIVSCISPSQIYWLKLVLGQLNQIHDTYLQRKYLFSVESHSNARASVDLTTNSDQARQETNQFSHSNVLSVDPFVVAACTSNSDLVDLDLSSPTCTSDPTVSPLVDSKLFWSCLTTDASQMDDRWNTEDGAYPSQTFAESVGTDERQCTVKHSAIEPKFSVSVNILCVALVLLYEDESVSRTQLSKPFGESTDMYKSVRLRSRPFNDGQRTPVNNSSQCDLPENAGVPKQFLDTEETLDVTESSCSGDYSRPSLSPVGCSNLQTLAALPGPFEFFSRFSGLLPWRQPLNNSSTVFDARSTRTSHSAADSCSLKETVTIAAPMRIDRSFVDTGQMTASTWMAHLRRQFAELASPRDHICFLGGLWHLDVFCRSVTESSTVVPAHSRIPSSRLTSECQVQSNFRAHLFGIELTECLFPGPCHPETSDRLEPVWYEILTFPNRPNDCGSLPVSETAHVAAVSCSGLFGHDMTSQSRLPVESMDFLHIDLAPCCVDIDVSIADRLHRILDAWNAVNEAVTKFLSERVDIPSRNASLWQSDPSDHAGARYHQTTPFALKRHSTTSFRPHCRHLRRFHGAPVDGYAAIKCPECTQDRITLKASCKLLEIAVRFPIPLEAVQSSSSQELFEIKKKLWTSSSPLHFDGFGSPGDKPTAQSLAWWCQCLRPEYLRIFISKLNAGCQVAPLCFGQSRQDVWSQFEPSAMRHSNALGRVDELRLAGAPEVSDGIEGIVSLRSLTVHLMSSQEEIQSAPLLQLTAVETNPELITVKFRLSSPGRQDLLETADTDVALAELGIPQPTHVSPEQGFEVGIDLASLCPGVTGTRSRADSSIPVGNTEWSLWKLTGPKHNPRTPFIIKRSFLQDAPKAHSKQTSYYPGDANHMAFYRQSASANTRLSVECKVSSALIQIDSKRTTELVYLRLVYDFLLWTSLLPYDRRLRATVLRRPQSANLSSHEIDRHYWFLSDSAPLASIYGHPEAARQAADLEATAANGSSTMRHPSGLHFLPLDSDDDLEDVFEDTQNRFNTVYDKTYNRTEIRPNGQVHPQPSVRPFHMAADVNSTTDFPSFATQPHQKTSNRHARQRSASEDDETDSTALITTVQKQSLACLQFDIDTAEVRVTVSGAANGCADQVLFSCSGVTIFFESGHDGKAELNYGTIELKKMELFHSLTDETGPMWIPHVINLPWSSMNYPNYCHNGTNADSQLHTAGCPMFSVAFKVCQTKRTHPVSGDPLYRDDFTCAWRVQEACLLHSPGDATLPGLLLRLLSVMEPPSASTINQVLPGYRMPDTLLIQHIHLEHISVAWSTPDAGRSTAAPKMQTADGVRALCGCESVNVTINTASSDFNDSCSGTRNGQSSVQPGMLIMVFINNAALFVCPVYRKSPATLDQRQSSCSNSSLFFNWINHLNLVDYVCVADLNHLELRCFSNPIITTQSTDWETPPINLGNRMDVRLTNNLLRLNTCADSLTALQALVESLAMPGRKSDFKGNKISPFMVDPSIQTSSSSNVETSGPARSNEDRGSSAHSSLCTVDRKSLQIVLNTSRAADSMEDLLQGAICDVGVNSRNSRLELEHSHRKDVVAPLQSSADPCQCFLKQTSPEPRPCRTPHFSGKQNGPLHALPVPDNDQSPSTGSDQQQLSIPCSPNAHHGKLDELESSDSSPNEFVLIKPSMVPSKSPTKPLSVVHFRCLQAFPEADTTGTSGFVDFVIRDDHYAPPLSLAGPNVRNRINRLFTDPSSVYPRATWALTLYNFAVEWNLYGGTDLSTKVFEPARIVDTIQHTMSDPRINRCHQVPTSPHLKRTSEATKVVGRSSPTVSDPDIGTLRQRSHRFKHDRPAIGPIASSNHRSHEQLIPTQSGPFAEDNAVPTIRERSAQGGKNRDTSKCISIRINGIYFRHAFFPPRTKTVSSTSSGNPASRCVLNIESLTIVDQVVKSKINQLLYGYKKTATGSAIPHNVNTPLFRLSIVCWRVPKPTNTLSPVQFQSSIRVENSLSNSLADSTSNYNRQDTDSYSNFSHELEAKISCQPLKINLDQHTLAFLEEFQELLTQCVLASEIKSNPISFPCSHTEQLSHRSETKTGASSKVAHMTNMKPDPRALSDVKWAAATTTGGPAFFIRKVTFYPDLPIRFDYHGRHVDWTAGSVQSIVRMLLQLHNAELVIPRRVYQRGYPSLDRLLSEVVADMRSVLIAQLPQLLATSIGPMHEVTQFLLGLWDLVYQPVYSLYHGSRSLSSVQSDVWWSYWHGTDLDMSIYGPSSNTAVAESTSAGGGFIQGLRCGTRSFSTSTLWATLQLSIQGVRAVQSIAETAYDLVTPGPALRSRQILLRQPANLREGFGNAVDAMSRGFQMISDDFLGATRAQSEAEVRCNKGPVGVVGDVIRQIPPTIVAPIVTGCEVTANILGGLRNQLRPEAKEEDEQKWKDTKGL